MRKFRISSSPIPTKTYKNRESNSNFVIGFSKFSKIFDAQKLN